LYFRVNVIQIPVPPLRERREDIEVLANYFLKEFNARHDRVKTMDQRVVSILQKYDWPGNVRELRNAIEHAHLLSRGDVLEPEALPEDILNKTGVELPPPAAIPSPVAPVATAPVPMPAGDSLNIPLSWKMDDVEKAFILAVYEKAHGNKTQAAKMLGIGLKTLYRKLRQYGIEGAEEVG